MRLELHMKRPVVFPDLDPETVLSTRRAKTVTEAWQAYGEALLEGNEHCMEMSESAEEILAYLDRQSSRLAVEKIGSGKYRLTDGTASIILTEQSDGTISLVFREGADGTDVTDFGPADVALFIKALFSSYRKVVSGRFNN